MFILTCIVRAVMLLRCLFSDEARQEFRTYQENASRGTKVYDSVCAVIGFCVLGGLCFVLCKGTFVLYQQVTSNDTVH